MSRSGRARIAGTRSQRPAHRSLIGPFEILEQVEAAGGVPAEMVAAASEERRSERAERAADAMNEATASLRDAVVDRGGQEFSIGDDRTRATAWILSVTNSMKESVPFEKRCRHIRAADPAVTEVRTVAAPNAGVWMCVECLAEHPEALDANLWPTECDLCGEQTTEFNAVVGNLPGCQVHLHICNHCASFKARTS